MVSSNINKELSKHSINDPTILKEHLTFRTDTGFLSSHRVEKIISRQTNNLEDESHWILFGVLFFPEVAVEEVGGWVGTGTRKRLGE